MNSHRSWFPFILTGLSLGLAAFIFAIYQNNDERPVVDSTPVEGRVMTAPDTRSDAPDVAPSGSDYQAAVRAILSSYEASRDAQAAWDTLIGLWVPVEYKGVHVDLIIAFAKLAASNTEDGTARLDAVVAANSWMTE